MPSFIATLTLMMLVSGAAILFTRSQKIAGLPDTFITTGQQLWLTGSLVLVLAFLVHLGLKKSIYGRWLYLVGLNRRAAEISGVPVKPVIVGVYIASGILAACGGVLLTASLETGDPVMGQNILLDVVGAAVLGGASLQGGKGSVWGAVCGVGFLVILGNCLVLMNVHYYYVTIVKGGVILAAAVLDTQRSTRA